MKKAFSILTVIAMLMCASFVFAKGKTKVSEAPVLTELQKIDQQLQALTQKRKQYLGAVQQIEIEIIKLQAVKNYIASIEAKEK